MKLSKIKIKSFVINHQGTDGGYTWVGQKTYAENRLYDSCFNISTII